MWDFNHPEHLAIARPRHDPVAEPRSSSEVDVVRVEACFLLFLARLRRGDRVHLLGSLGELRTITGGGTVMLVGCRAARPLARRLLPLVVAADDAARRGRPARRARRRRRRRRRPSRPRASGRSSSASGGRSVALALVFGFWTAIFGFFLAISAVVGIILESRHGGAQPSLGLADR